MNHSFFYFLPLATLFMFSCTPSKENIKEPAKKSTSDTHEVAPIKANQCMLSLHVTTQAYSLLEPWQKKEPEQNSSFVIYIGNGKFLCTASPLQNATIIQLKSPSHNITTHTVTAHIDCIDYEANLAMLSLAHKEDAQLLETLQAVQIGEQQTIDSKVTLISFNNQGANIENSGSIESSNLGDAGFTYLSIKLDRGLTENDTSLPVIANNKLISFTTYYNEKQQVADAINPDVLKRFIERAGKDYKQFSHLGISITPTEDPVFHKYLKLPNNVGGIYLTKISPRSEAEKAGLKEGDVITKIGHKPIDNRGYIHHDKLGKVMWNYDFRNLLAQGDLLHLEFYRDGKAQETHITLNRNSIDDDIIPSHHDESPPLYIVYGGYVFQELTQDYLDEVNSRNNNRTPHEFLRAIDNKESLLKEGRRRLLVISQIIPTPSSLGYENAGFCLVETANGKPIKDLKEFATIIDTPSPEGILTLTTNKAPYMIYIEQAIARQVNDYLQQRAIPILRKLD